MQPLNGKDFSILTWYTFCMEKVESFDVKNQMDKNLDKLENLNHINTDSFWGIIAALFLLLIYNNYLFQSFFSLFEGNMTSLILISLVWYVIFFMIQAGIIKVIYRKLSSATFILNSPIKNFREFIRFILCLLFGAFFFSFTFNFYYPFKIFSTSLINQIIFYLISAGISILYWKYVEHYNHKSVYVPKLSEYGLMGWITIIIVMIIFGSVAVFVPYTVLGFIGFGIWLIMISRFLLEG